MSTIPTSATIPIQEFRAKLQEAVEARGTRYHSTKVFIFRFEDDATGADCDANTFSGCMQDVFGIDHMEDFAIKKTSKSPGFDVHKRIVRLVDTMIHARSLLIIAYIGHAVIHTESNRLQLISENGSQKMPWSFVHEPFLASSSNDLQNLDRSVQLLAACDERSTVRSKKDGVTFIQRVRQAAYALKNSGNLSVNVERLFGELQRLKPSKAPDAVHKIIGNARPLVLSVKHISSSALQHSTSSSNETNVLFKISLTGGPRDVLLSEFLQLTKRIPPVFKVSLENAYESHSIVLLCRASWETFARLRSTLDCAFVASVKGPSLVQEVPQ
ncbi:hypothetical protein V1505DRAFT_417702 [Lipomyces doorenjongii]